jgi:hypothetical protein
MSIKHAQYISSGGHNLFANEIINVVYIMV